MEKKKKRARHKQQGDYFGYANTKAGVEVDEVTRPLRYEFEQHDYRKHDNRVCVAWKRTRRGKRNCNASKPRYKKFAHSPETDAT